MSKPLEKQRAIELRRAGLSYREIRRQVPVAKATLSLWLRSVGLSKPQKQRLTVKRLLAARRGWEKLRKEKLARVAAIWEDAGQEAARWLAAREMLWLIGTVLYWAEGQKVKEWASRERFCFTNMDPRVLLIVRDWLRAYCGVSDGDMELALYIHSDADVSAAQRFWCDTLAISQRELRIYFKRPNPNTRRRNIGRTYYGTMRLSVRRSTALSHRVMAWIQSVARHCGVG